MLKQVGCNPADIRGIGISMSKLGRYLHFFSRFMLTLGNNLSITRSPIDHLSFKQN